MSIPDFRQPLLFEIGLAKEITIKAISEIPYKPSDNPRYDLAYAFLHIGAEHVMSILHLFEVSAISSGNALIRPALETLYKSVWIATVAENDVVAKAWEGKDVYGSFQNVISDLKKEHSSSSIGALFAKVEPYRRTLNELTHSGAEQLLRRLRSQDMRSPEFEFSVLIRDLRTLPAAVVLAAGPLISQDRLDSLQAFMKEKHPWVVNMPTS